MHLSKDNRGATLIELVIAMMIAAIVLGMIMFFINGVAKSFQRTSDEVNLQIEAQTTINHISNIVMKAKDMEVYPATGVPDPVTGVIRYTFSCNNNEFYTLIFDSNEDKLYQVQTGGFAEGQTVAYSLQDHFLAEYIDRLMITKNANNSATIELFLVLGNDSYNVKKTMKMRNAE